MRVDSTFKKSLQKCQFEEKRKIGSSSKTITEGCEERRNEMQRERERERKYLKGRERGKGGEKESCRKKTLKLRIVTEGVRASLSRSEG